MPKLLLSLVLLVFYCNLSMADECKPPRIVEDKIIHKLPRDNTTPVIFSGYKINIENPTTTIFNSNILIYIYGQGDTKRTLSIQSLPDTLKDSNNKYNTTKAYKLVFGLEKENNPDVFILSMRNGLQLCDAEITQYSIEGIKLPIIKTNIVIMGKKDTIFYIVNDIEPYIDMVQFSNFTNEQIDQVISSLQAL